MCVCIMGMLCCVYLYYGDAGCVCVYDEDIVCVCYRDAVCVCVCVCVCVYVVGTSSVWNRASI